MDGNGRWAKERGLPRAAGHRKGLDAVRNTVKSAIQLHIPFLTVFSFSSENWSRPAAEIDDLMNLVKGYIRRDLEDLHRHGVRIRVIGEATNVEPELLALIEEAQALTRNNAVLNLLIAFNYGARNEITKAARRLATRVANGELDPHRIEPGDLEAELDTAGVPDPDLLIRTSGELRLSNFLLWQCAYAELVFLDVYWPDFDRAQLELAIAEFRSRSRRFGGLAASAEL